MIRPIREMVNTARKQLFGTDGIRGVAGEYPLDASTVYRLGKALLRLGKKRVLIGRDTRASGVWIERVLAQALASEGTKAALAGVITTPGVAFLSQKVPFEAGIVISASHNPYQDNGIKVFSNGGTKLRDDEEIYLEELLAGENQVSSLDKVSPAKVPDSPAETTACNAELADRYSTFLRTAVLVQTLRPLKVVLDCANGAAFRLAPDVFARLEAKVIPINAEPNGRNINHNCGSLFPEQMVQTVVAHQASFGVAFDGDGDRAIFSDEKGNVLDGDHVLYLLARHLGSQDGLGSGAVVTTVMANMGLEVALAREDLRVIRTRVGDRYVLEEMLRGDHWLGGEQSGHIIIRAHSVAGDGILTAVKIAEILVREGCSLSALVRGFEKFPQVQMNVQVREKRDFTQIPEIQREIETAHQNLNGKGRVVVRYSGTEPLVRIMIEGENESDIRTYAQAIAGQFREKLGLSTDS